MACRCSRRLLKTGGRPKLRAKKGRAAEGDKTDAPRFRPLERAGDQASAPVSRSG